MPDHPGSEFSRQKWNRKYADPPAVPDRPSQVLIDLQDWLPPAGRMLDVAAGAGRNGLWFAQQGWQVTLADISTVGLRLAGERAREQGLTVSTIEFDLEQSSFPVGPWRLIFVHLFLWRPLFRLAAEQLEPGGRLIVIQPTVVNLQRHDKPPRDFLLDRDELPALIESSGLHICLARETWDADGRHDAVVVAEKRTDD